MTQEQLAMASKLSQPAIARMERGQVNPQWDSLERIAAALGAGICELLCGRARQDGRVSKLSNRAAAILQSKDDFAIVLMLNGFAAAETVLSRPPARVRQRRRQGGTKKSAASQRSAPSPGYNLYDLWLGED
jgi:transcriptional regulator with XRE-family HTH domain